MKVNELRIAGRDVITLVTPKGTMGGFVWTGKVLGHPKAKALRFNDEVTAEIQKAIESYVPDKVERKLGYEIKAEDNEGWVYQGSKDDAHGVYERVIKGTGPIIVRFGKEDLV